MTIVNHSGDRRLTMPGARCVLCDAASQARPALCRACRAELPWLARPEPLRTGAAFAPASDWSMLRYQGPVRAMLHALKYDGALEYAEVLGELLAQMWPALGVPALVVPVPLHRARLRERGYNQAVELMRPLKRRHAVEIARELCQRRRPTAEQSRLSREARRRNVRGSFASREPLRGEAVTIFDDVVTTGATVLELARTLRRAGAGEVHVISIARATSDLSLPTRHLALS